MCGKSGASRLNACHLHVATPTGCCNYAFFIHFLSAPFLLRLLAATQWQLPVLGGVQDCGNLEQRQSSHLHVFQDSGQSYFLLQPSAVKMRSGQDEMLSKCSGGCCPVSSQLSWPAAHDDEVKALESEHLLLRSETTASCFIHCP